jgi:hypothetical protein
MIELKRNLTDFLIKENVFLSIIYIILLCSKNSEGKFYLILKGFLTNWTKEKEGKSQK